MQSEEKLSKSTYNKLFLIFVILGIVIITIFSVTTSPLYNDYYAAINSSESVANLVIGKGIAQGYLPYRDLFGCYGPVFYILEAIGYLIGIGKYFVYFLQIIMLVSTEVCLFSLFHIYKSTRKCLFLVILVLFPFVATISGGNNADEFCLPFIVIAVYIVIRSLRGEMEEEKAMKILGICFALVFYIRWIQAFCILGIILYMVFKKKEKKYLCMLHAFAPWAIATVSILIIFTANSALSEMVYGVFIYPAKALFSGNSTVNECVRKLIKVTPSFLLAVETLLMNKRSENRMLFIFAIINCGVLLTGQGYWYYYTVLCFHIPLLLSLISWGSKKNRMVSIFNLAFMFAVYIIPFKNIILDIMDNNYLVDNEIKISWYEENASNVEQILLVDGGASFYLINDCMPSERFFSNQSAMSKIDSIISEELILYTEESDDPWLLVGSKGWVYEEYGNYTMIDTIMDASGWPIYIYALEEGAD